MKYLLDTCTISYFVRGDQNVLDNIKNTSPSDLCISSITLMEIEFGLVINTDRAKKIQPILMKFLENIPVLPFTQEDARCAAVLRAALHRKGNSIGAYDILLAGCALHRGLIFVTSNSKEFKRISGLLLEDWRNELVTEKFP